MEKATQFFDKEYYLTTYHDIAEAGVDPYNHYLELGWKEGRNPRADFDNDFYLSENPDVRAANICPLIHYVEHGIHEGRLPFAGYAPKDNKILRSNFDEDFYLRKYQDVASASVDPFQHYISVGWKEGRNPSAEFDTLFYLQSYPEVAARGICPLIDYVEIGMSAGRSGKRPRDATRERIYHAVPLLVQARAWQLEKRPVASNAEECKREFDLAISNSRNGVIFAISHDDYATIYGGIQQCLAEEEARCRDLGISYIHLCPTQPLPTLSKIANEDFDVRLKINGRDLGSIRIEEIYRIIGISEIKKLDRFIVVHHLLGFSASSVLGLFDVVAPKETIFWLHDFFSLCPKYNLLRNDAIFCSAPAPSSAACSICAFGDDRVQNLKEVEFIFENIRPVILSPSQTALDFWSSHTDLKFRTCHVAAHGNLVPRAWASRNNSNAQIGKQLRVAFVGAPVYHKGWETFKRLAERLKDDERYTFVQLGAPPEQELPYIRNIPVMTNRDDRRAMSNAIRALEIDVALILSVWPETFCFTAHEAIAGGAFLVAAKSAGHAAVLAGNPISGSGIVVACREELDDLFDGSTLPQKVRGISRDFDFIENSGTLEWIMGQNR